MKKENRKNNTRVRVYTQMFEFARNNANIQWQAGTWKINGKCNHSSEFHPINFWLNKWKDHQKQGLTWWWWCHCERNVNTQHRTEELIIERSKCEQGFIWYKKEIIHVRPVPKTDYLYHTTNCWIKHTKKTSLHICDISRSNEKNWFISTSTARTF